MPLPSAGQPISMSMINTELGNAATDTLDLQTAGDAFSGVNTDGVYSMDEFYGLSLGAPVFTTGLGVTADNTDPSKTTSTWAVSVPSGAPAISSFTLKRATDSGMTTNLSTVLSNSNGGGSPFVDNVLSLLSTSATTTIYYQASATNSQGTTNSSVVSDDALAKRTTINTRHMEYDGDFVGWTGSALIEAAELTVPDSGDYPNYAEHTIDTDTAHISTVSGPNETFNNNDVLFNNSTGTTLFVYNDSFNYGANGSGGEAHFVDVTQNNIFTKPNGSGVVATVFSRTPATPSAPTQNGSPQSDEVFISITSDTRVTRTLQVSRSVSPYTSYSGVGTVTPTSKGSEDDTSVVTNFTDTTVSANTSYRYKVRGVNNSFDGSLSAQSDIITTAATGTSISSTPASPSISVFNDPFADPTETDSAVGSLITVSIINRVGNSTITESETMDGNFQFAWSTSDDPGESGTDNGGSGFVGGSVSNVDGDTIYIRPKFTEGGRDNNETGTGNINVTNNSVSHDKTVSITVSGGIS